VDLPEAIPSVVRPETGCNWYLSIRHRSDSAGDHPPTGIGNGIVEAKSPYSLGGPARGSRINGSRTPGDRRAPGRQFTLTSLRTNDAGNYTVAVINPAGRVGSRTAVVGVVASAQITFGLIDYFKFDEPDGSTT